MPKIHEYSLFLKLQLLVSLTVLAVLPQVADENPEIGLQILGRSEEANAIDTQDDNFKSSLSNISLKPIRNWTEIQ